MKHNIFVIGVGGQGVITLGKIIAIAGKLDGYDITGYENKGGAQRGGKASSLICLFKDMKPYSVSNRIMSGKIDTLLSMDLFETARNIALCTENTTIVSNKWGIIPPLARNTDTTNLNPEKIQKALNEFSSKVYMQDFSGMAARHTGSIINTNLLLLNWAICNHSIFLNKEHIKEAAEQVLGKLDDNVENIFEMGEEDFY